MRKAKEISALLAEMRNDENRYAIPVTIELRIGGESRSISLEGRYLIDMASENAIKAMDGVVSVTEDVESAQTPSIAA
jgi:DNA polymerase III subunit alpha